MVRLCKTTIITLCYVHVTPAANVFEDGFVVDDVMYFSVLLQMVLF